MYRDGAVLAELVEFFGDYLLSPFVAITLLVCSIVTVVLVLHERT